MDEETKISIRAVVKERRKLLNRITKTEAKLHRLRSRVVLCEVKLVCFGHDVERLRKAKPSRKMFRGRSLYRRILDLLRTTGRPLTIAEIAAQLAMQDGRDPAKHYIRLPGKARVKDALKRARKRPRSPLRAERDELGRNLWRLECLT